MNDCLVLIPARLAASRLPGKPLADIAGLPMIIRVWQQAMASGAARVAIATDSSEIAEVVRQHGGEAVMTRPDHPSGSDRIEEAAGLLDPAAEHDIIINLQGDLPEIDPAMLPVLVAGLAASGADLATPVAPASASEALLPQVVKAVVAWPQSTAIRNGSHGRALYFSRHPVPLNYGRSATEDAGGHTTGLTPPGHWHHIGIYAWRRAALERFVHLPPSPLEQAEKLEQLRALEAGMRIEAVAVDKAPGGIDTPEDLAAVRARFGNP